MSKLSSDFPQEPNKKTKVEKELSPLSGYGLDEPMPASSPSALERRGSFAAMVGENETTRSEPDIIAELNQNIKELVISKDKEFNKNFPWPEKWRKDIIKAALLMQKQKTRKDAEFTEFVESVANKSPSQFFSGGELMFDFQKNSDNSYNLQVSPPLPPELFFMAQSEKPQEEPSVSIKLSEQEIENFLKSFEENRQSVKIEFAKNWERTQEKETRQARLQQEAEKETQIVADKSEESLLDAASKKTSFPNKEQDNLLRNMKSLEFLMVNALDINEDPVMVEHFNQWYEGALVLNPDHPAFDPGALEYKKFLEKLQEIIAKAYPAIKANEWNEEFKQAASDFFLNKKEEKLRTFFQKYPVVANFYHDNILTLKAVNNHLIYYKPQVETRFQASEGEGVTVKDKTQPIQSPHLTKTPTKQNADKQNIEQEQWYNLSKDKQHLGAHKLALTDLEKQQRKEKALKTQEQQQKDPVYLTTMREHQQRVVENEKKFNHRLGLTQEFVEFIKSKNPGLEVYAIVSNPSETHKLGLVGVEQSWHFGVKIVCQKPEDKKTLMDFLKKHLPGATDFTVTKMRLPNDQAGYNFTNFVALENAVKQLKETPSQAKGPN